MLAALIGTWPGRILGLALAAATALGAVYWLGRSDQADEERLERAERALEEREVRDDVEEDLRSTPADERRRGLRDWTVD